MNKLSGTQLDDTTGNTPTSDFGRRSLIKGLATLSGGLATFALTQRVARAQTGRREPMRSMLTAAKKRPFTVTPFRSDVLGKDLDVVPVWGRDEPSFVGGGRCGGGATSTGDWDFLIGPDYTSPNFLARETLFLESGGHRWRLPSANRRIYRSGILMGQTTVGEGIAIELYEYAPWDQHEVIRLAGVRNNTAGPFVFAITAEIEPQGAATIKDNLLEIRQPKGALSYGRENKNWAERCCRIGFDQPQQIEADVEASPIPVMRLRTKLIIAEPGELVTVGLVHSLQFGDKRLDTFGPFSLRKDLAIELDGWNKWTSRGKCPARTDQRILQLTESILVGMRMQQSYDGGMIAGVRRYPYSYMRDMHGAAKGFLSAGHLEEAAAMIRWLNRKFAKFHCVVNASEMGTEGGNFVGGSPSVEIPAYFLLLVRSYVRAGGEPALADEVREALEWCAQTQIAEGRANDWRLGFNGDETERYVPTADGQTYQPGAGEITYGVAPGWKYQKWSFPSQILAIASLEFAIKCAERWGVSATPYVAAREAFAEELGRTFVEPKSHTAAWCIYADGTRPQFPLTNYLLFPAWLQTRIDPQQTGKLVEVAMRYLKPDGILPVAPGVVEGTCGHSLGLLLAGLKETSHNNKHNDVDIVQVEELVFTSGILGRYGMVNEYYGPTGVPNPHNLRSFESGILLEALLRKTRSSLNV
jgi:hypothetical protein